jgi:hypothetical protein
VPSWTFAKLLQHLNARAAPRFEQDAKTGPLD